MSGSAGSGCCRSRSLCFGDTLFHGEASNKLAECSVTIHPGEARSVFENADLWSRIGDVLAEFSDVAAQTHAPVAVDSAQVCLHQCLGDEKGVCLRNSQMLEDTVTGIPELISLHGRRSHKKAKLGDRMWGA